MHALEARYANTSPLTVMTVAEVMTPGVINCSPDTPLRTVAALMTTYRVHSIFVYDYSDGADQGPQLWGLVTDLDLVAAARHNFTERTAGESAVAPLVTVLGSDTLERAAELMAFNGVSHLAVVDPSVPRPVGVVSTLDIARAIASADGTGEARPVGLG